MVPLPYHSPYSGTVSGDEFVRRLIEVITVLLAWIAPFVRYRLKGKPAVASKTGDGKRSRRNQTLRPSERKALLIYLGWVIGSSVIVIVFFEHVANF